jgi:hypothetical protein
MKTKTIFVSLVMLLLLITNINSSGNGILMKPFRVVLVIGDQWEDPASYLVEMPHPTGRYSGYGEMPEVPGASDFHDLTVMLKSWGIPFDVIRLDQQYLDRYMFLDMSGVPKYGTIIWDVNLSERLLNPDYSIITEMVKDYGIGLIALSDCIFQPEIQSILGIQYKGSWESNKPLTLNGKHFITNGLNSTFLIDKGTEAHVHRQQVELLDGTVAVVNQGIYPQVTVRECQSGGRVVWIGSDYNYMFSYPDIRTLLRRAITWTIGYNLFKTWENNVIMIMDDPGGIQNAWLEHWHYPTLTEDVIEKYLIKPLQEHNAVLNINFLPGIADDEKRRLEPTWQKQFMDAFGTKQDYVSSKKGYDKGIKLGVFEVMCHGLTHMQPDLVSEPGWYGTPLDQERAEVGWYREFGDTRRQGEIPAAEQLWRMKTSKEWLTRQFGVVPLQFCAGGNGTSITYFNNTAKLAALAGFGWCGWATGYLGPDMVITSWKYFGTPESPLIIPAPPDAHDFGVSRTPDVFATVFDQYPKYRFFSMNEFIGYLHASNSGEWNDSKKILQLNIDYDPHYCMHFATHPTVWNLEFSDWMQEKVEKISSVTVDGGKIVIQNSKIKIPSGTGIHRIVLSY